jgi:anion-transporting  ArsA/GET3 family ATPase
VTGKGGVGKTTVAYALGLAAAERGKRVCVCEIASQERGADLFGKRRSEFAERQLAKGLWSISVDPDKMVGEYLETHMPVRAMAGLLRRSTLFNYLAAATPGLPEMVTMGKVWELMQKPRKAKGARRTYDLVVVDAPATGHGVGFLQTPRTFREIARVGPLASQAKRIEEIITDRDRAGVAIVARPEEMAVNESIELEATLLNPPKGSSFAVDRIFANGVYPDRYSAAERKKIAGVPAGVRAETEPALEAVAEEAERRSSQESQLARLREGTVGSITELPFLFEPRFGEAELRELAAAVTT